MILRSDVSWIVFASLFEYSYALVGYGERFVLGTCCGTADSVTSALVDLRLFCEEFRARTWDGQDLCHHPRLT